MTVYVAQISGRGIAAFSAADDAEAEARVADRAFQAELHVLQHEGRPLWDGVSDIHVRRALPAEAETWHASRDAAISSSKSPDREDWRVFLVTVVDPSIERFDDDDDRNDNDNDNDD